jgi:hypothetical protein
LSVQRPPWAANSDQCSVQLGPSIQLRSPDFLLLSRFAPVPGLVALRQTFVRRCQSCVVWAQSSRDERDQVGFGCLGNHLKSAGDARMSLPKGLTSACVHSANAPAAVAARAHAWWLQHQAQHDQRFQVVPHQQEISPMRCQQLPVRRGKAQGRSQGHVTLA